ncbi:nuclear transport factor 2 family protein [Novosphingobium sp. ERN07]|uniref:nuclear transport factor 2 family protein n=1 Tax=Novosphingobium sp. ERN07 TaxID=2726187 RepID=UPI00145688DB|nr:nuclear transport factor 2 family protein [Novosphingobium sp. ERN07]NLR73189.1 nuclear transport factor 2 family protein [Novosphingobium sp. ERN07]
MSTLQAVIDRIEIADVLIRYARAVDRLDSNLFETVWAEKATVDYGEGAEDARAWTRGMLDRIGSMDRTQHSLSNSLVDVNGNFANAETQCTAYHLIAGDEGATAMIVGGRYLDQLERTAAGWRISQRRYVMDWNETHPSNCELGKGRFARFSTIGGRAPHDLSYSQ